MKLILALAAMVALTHCVPIPHSMDQQQEAALGDLHAKLDRILERLGVIDAKLTCAHDHDEQVRCHGDVIDAKLTCAHDHDEQVRCRDDVIDAKFDVVFRAGLFFCTSTLSCCFDLFVQVRLVVARQSFCTSASGRSETIVLYQCVRP